MKEKRIGAFICHCGGNISDYVDVEKVCEAAGGEPGVAVARTFLFACSDASQEEMVRAIREDELDGVVIASCSPKLHLNTFRAMALRAGLNPYMYSQVNIREQCSWAHRHDREGATDKALRLLRAGIARTRLGRPLTDLRVETIPKALVVGAGVAGMRAAIALADLGIAVFLIERSPEVGGRVAGWGRMFPHDREGAEIVATLRGKIRERENITLFTGAELLEKQGSVGNFTATVHVGNGETMTLTVGSIVVATGFDPYSPREGEYGYGQEGVITLPEFKELLATSPGKLRSGGRDVETIVYIYCVGSRQSPCAENPAPNRYCSRACCATAVHAALQAREKDASLSQYHLYRDMRTYGKSEILFEEAGKKGSVFLKFPDGTFPSVERSDGLLLVRARDELLGGEEIEIPADLVVLVTGMVPRENDALLVRSRSPSTRGGSSTRFTPNCAPWRR